MKNYNETLGAQSAIVLFYYKYEVKYYNYKYSKIKKPGQKTGLF